MFFTIFLTILNSIICFFVDYNDIVTNKNRGMYLILFFVLCIPYILNVMRYHKKRNVSSWVLMSLFMYVNIVFTYSFCYFLVAGNGAGFFLIFSIMATPLAGIFGLLFDLPKHIEKYKNLDHDTEIDKSLFFKSKLLALSKCYFVSYIFVILYYALCGRSVTCYSYECYFQKEYGLTVVIEEVFNYFKSTFYFFIPYIILRKSRSNMHEDEMTVVSNKPIVIGTNEKHEKQKKHKNDEK